MSDIPLTLKLALGGSVLSEGSAADVDFRVVAVELGDGTKLSLPPTGVTAIVGPNNAGKSTLLRETRERLHAEMGFDPVWRLVRGVEVGKVGGPGDVVAWLAKHSRYSAAPDNAGFVPVGRAQIMSPAWLNGTLAYTWSQAAEQGRLGAMLAPFFVHYADTASRLDQSLPAPSRADARAAATHPVHVLADDRSRLRQASLLAQEVFGEPLHLDDYSAEMRLKVGSLGIEAPPRDSTDMRYRDALLDLPDLAQQGDGMRSFFGLLLPLLSRNYPVVLVDEPEAFLHPPQARALGRALGRLTRDGELQLMLATHDRNLLSGLLESGVELSVVRVDRFGEAGKTARQIDPDSLRDLWSDAALRYSNALDGLFHRLVVLVEGDADARFYSACLDAAQEGGGLDIPAGDVLFVPCGGKGGMTRLARALHGLGVPVVASPDIDILRGASELRALVEALGGDWESVKSDYEAALVSVQRNSAPLQIGDLLDILGDDRNAPLTIDSRRAVERLIRTAGGGWAQIKAGGLRALGTGGTGAAASRLVEALDRCGVVVVREGELESFAPELGVAKGPSWVPAALAADAHKRPSPQEHAKRLVAAAGPR